MKLTPRCQGKRFRRNDWADGKYVDIRVVSKTDKKGLRMCRGVDELGQRILFWTKENEAGWIRVKKEVRP